jgi:hypothetical protein
MTFLLSKRIVAPKGAADGVASKYSPCCTFGVGRIALAAQSAAGPIRTIDLGHLYAALLHVASQSGTVGTSTFNASPAEPTERARPFDQLFVSARRGRKRMRRSDATDLVDQDRHMHVEMRVNTENNLVLFPWGGSCSSPECVALRCQPNRTTGHSRCKQTKLLSGHRRRARQREGNAGPQSTGECKGRVTVKSRLSRFGARIEGRPAIDRGAL